jgi:hypothetical protein
MLPVFLCAEPLARFSTDRLIGLQNCAEVEKDPTKKAPGID